MLLLSDVQGSKYKVDLRLLNTAKQTVADVMDGSILKQAADHQGMQMFPESCFVTDIPCIQLYSKTLFVHLVTRNPVNYPTVVALDTSICVAHKGRTIEISFLACNAWPQILNLAANKS
jgi:hypothetical protein